MTTSIVVAEPGSGAAARPRPRGFGRPPVCISNSRAAPPNPAAVYVASLPSPHSRRAARRALDGIARRLSAGRASAATFAWWQLTHAEVVAVRAQLAACRAPATVNLHLAFLRGTLLTAWRLGLLTREACARALDVRPVRGRREPRGRLLGDDAVRALRDAARGTPGPRRQRDPALLAVLLNTGMRRAELVALQLDDVAFATRDGVRQARLGVRGKGHRERVVYLGRAATAALDAWLAVRGPAPGAVFVPIDQRGALAHRPLSPHALYLWLQDLARRAGLAALSPHDLRRTAISQWWESGVDGATIQALAGHASIAMTARYDRRGEEAKRRASLVGDRWDDLKTTADGADCSVARTSGGAP